MSHKLEIQNEKVDSKAEIQVKPVEEVVEEYLNSQRKPFSINDLVLNLNNKFKKPLLVNTLENLFKENRIVIIVFGKVSIYAAKDIEIEPVLQDISQEDKENKEENELPNQNPIYLSEQILQLREEQGELTRDLKQLKNFIATESKNPSNNELPTLIEGLEKRLGSLNKEIEIMKNNTSGKKSEADGKLNKNFIETIQKQEKILDKEMKQRKKYTRNLLKLLAETRTPEKLNEVLEDIGFEDIQ